MPSPIGLAVKLALTPTGRRMIRHTVRAARSDQGRTVFRTVFREARRLATGPTARKLLIQAFKDVFPVGKKPA
jgi:hypothetical protein